MPETQRAVPPRYAVRHSARELPAVLRRLGLPPSRLLLIISVSRQCMWLCRAASRRSQLTLPEIHPLRRYVISSSAWGVGQQVNSQQTPLGLHQIARKIGGGHPTGTVFRSRRAVGATWRGRPGANIVHRILWLEGLQPGLNRGGNVDTFRRYIYIHGFGDETTLGRRWSHGCIHLAGADLIPLYDWLPVGTLVWVARY